jgi:hypothetical protein
MLERLLVLVVDRWLLDTDPFKRRGALCVARILHMTEVLCEYQYV